jgi:spore coat polysaccharide biosynthesis protein SpsF (cytidylyltransferase family)
MIVVFVPCRLKSTRYPNKGISDIYGITAIERTLINAQAIPGVDKVILATSTEKVDDPLLHCNLDGSIEVVRGSEDDVLARIIPYIEKNKPDYVIRVTGDCPLVSGDLAELLIQSHIETGADLTYTPSKTALGIACEIYKAQSLLKLRTYFPQTLHSEYLIYYFTNNHNLFQVNEFSAQDKFIKNWRLTFDEPNDLELLCTIYSTLDIKNRSVSFDEIISFFDRYPEASQININNIVKYRDNQDLISYLKNATTYKGT